MDNRLESLPDELIEKIHETIHREKYAIVLKELESEVLRLIVRRLIDEVLIEAVTNITS